MRIQCGGPQNNEPVRIDRILHTLMSHVGFEVILPPSVNISHISFLHGC